MAKIIINKNTLKQIVNKWFVENEWTFTVKEVLSLRPSQDALESGAARFIIICDRNNTFNTPFYLWSFYTMKEFQKELNLDNSVFDIWKYRHGEHWIATKTLASKTDIQP